MRSLFLILILFGIRANVCGQTDALQTDTTKSVYGRLLVKKWREIRNCRPCIIERYDSAQRIIEKSVRYTDCPVGFYITYFPNGKVRAIGHYRENLTRFMQ